ncbi:MAG: 4Fe-4S binding protein [Solidesulfovibrio sp.]|uniref:4Fe-4S binding protein n=1 Tax=Solidesulfovibrio sp. TaxID=2910990 RepID=UPI00315874BE
MSERAVAAKATSAGLRPWRRAIQVAGAAVLGQWSLYGVLRCPFIVPYVSCQNCPVITCHGRLFSMFWGFWLLLPLSVLLVGRAFCGWACPGGLAVQLLGKVAPLGRRYGGKLAGAANWGKYLAVAACLYVYYALNQPRADVPIRVGAFFESVALTFEHADNLWLVRTAVVLGMLALGLVVSAAWCRFACPTGGLLEAVKGVALLKVFKTGACTGCGKCDKVCALSTRPEEANCTNCGDCVHVCPAGAIGFGRKPGQTGQAD